MKAALCLGATVGSVTAVLSVAPPLPAAGARCTPAWRVVRSPAIRDGELDGVAARSSSDAWAVGRAGASPLIQHWDGGRWLVASSPRVRGGRLLSVAAVSASDAWAVGRTGAGRHPSALIEHWDGRRWTIVPLELDGHNAVLVGVAATATDDVWAVGGDLDGDGSALVLHWDGNAWGRVVNRSKSWLFDVVAISRRDVWAVGAADDYQKLLAVHWDGVRWNAFVLPPPSAEDYPVQLYGVTALSARDVWAVGSGHAEEFSALVEHGDLFHWNGRRWRTTKPVPRDGALYGVAAVSPTEVWTVGTDEDRYLDPYNRPPIKDPGLGSFVARLRTGAWHATDLHRGQRLNDIAADPATTLWAVGATGRGSRGYDYPVRSTPLIERYGC